MIEESWAEQRSRVVHKMSTMDMREQQQQASNNQRAQNRYAHLVTSGPTVGGDGRHQTPGGTNLQQAKQNVVVNLRTIKSGDQSSAVAVADQQQQRQQNGQHHQRPKCTNKPPPLAAAAGLDKRQSNGQPNNNPATNSRFSSTTNNNYYSSFSTVDWREQWIMFKEKTMEKVEEPECQRKLIMLIVCTALLLDNMLYMVIVPIIPDYLRSIGAWSTYTENAKWIRKNSTRGRTEWEQVGGQTVYEGEDSAVGFLFASKAIVQLIANPFSGAIADRIGYEIPMMFGLIVMFLSTMVFACGQTYSILFLARSLQGVGSAFADTTGLAMLADRFTEETERRRAQGIAIAFISFGCLVAPPFGSVLYQGAGKEVPFIILSLVCLLDGSLLLLVAPPGTFSQLLPSYYYGARNNEQSAKQQHHQQQQQSITPIQSPPLSPPTLTASNNENSKSTDEEQQQQSASSQEKKRALYRQKSISRRHSMTVSAGGEAPKGTPIEVLLRDKCIACCAGALVVANISLAFLEPTISIWVKNTMPGTEEWQEGMIWLPAFFPHVLGVFSTLHVAEKYPRSTWMIATAGLLIEGLGCLVVPFCSSFWSLIFPISIICFGVALIDTAILPTLGYLVDTRFTSVYGNVYAIADISYSLSYAIGPVIAGGIVEAIGFTALNFLIAVVTFGYTPSLMMLRSVHDYEPFEADQTGLAADRAKPFGQFGRAPIEEEEEEEDGGNFEAIGHTNQQHQRPSTTTRYESPAWAGGGGGGFKKTTTTNTGDSAGTSSVARPPKSVTIVEDSAAEQRYQASSFASEPQQQEFTSDNKNPFLGQ